MKDYIKAHEFCRNHRKQLKMDGVCGCFYCLAVFSPAEIKEWIVEDASWAQSETAICPYCGIDAVIGESSGYLSNNSRLFEKDACILVWISRIKNGEKTKGIRKGVA